MSSTDADVTSEVRERVLALARRSPRAAGADVTAWFRTLGDAGLLGVAVPEAYGGSELGICAAVAALEALGEGGLPGGVLFSVGAHVWAVQMPLLRHGNDGQRAKYLPSLCAGTTIGAIALSEAGSGSDVFAMRTRVEKRDDRFVLHGRKAWCTNAPVAGLFLVFAASSGADRLRACSAFLVDRDAPGLFVESPTRTLGLDASPMADVVLEDCEVPRSALLGQSGRGAQVFHDGLTWERGALAAPFVGAMKRQLDACVEFARTREAFGEPIGRFQAIAHRIAEMRLRLETARLLVHRFAVLKDAGEEASLEASLVKVHVSEAYLQSSLDAIQIHGALGYAVESGVEADLRDAVGLRVASGTNDIQRSLISQALGL
jgi:alkylation response protein AidB-like acyl-CoA dehydrogenase